MWCTTIPRAVYRPELGDLYHELQAQVLQDHQRRHRHHYIASRANTTEAMADHDE